MSGPTVEKCKAKVDLAKKLGVSVRRISKGQKIRTNIFHSEQSGGTVFDSRGSYEVRFTFFECPL
jgi:hypothetical protein